MTRANGQEHFEALPINPDRACEGISKIGYQPAAAIMDIVDNSVAADASQIEIELILREDATLSKTGGIVAFRIVDDGRGMDEDRISLALQIGSEVVYAPDSLSKFGFGLKSAGFSLGRRISVFSRREGVTSAMKILDRDVIRQRGQYGVLTEPLPEDDAARLASRASGTVVLIENPPARQDSAGRIRKELQQRLGIIYQHFFVRAGRPLRITIRIRSEVESIVPLDLLFWEDAARTFEPDNYDPSRPCRLGDHMIENPADPNGPKFRLQMACFPMDKMKGYAGFSQDQRKRVASYQINRENSGFFFYRNGRLIRWGDKIAGAGRDHIGFRAKVSFSTAHDELFHVDVSKQNLAIPEELLRVFNEIAYTALGNSKQAFEHCKELLDVNNGLEGYEFNRRTETFEENDAAEDLSPPPPEEKRRRRERINRKTKEVLAAEEVAEAVGVPSAAMVEQEQEPTFQRVRYSDRVSGLNFASSGFDTDYGTFVRINKNHAFYRQFLANLPAADPSRAAIEALIFAFAVAETKTVQNLVDVADETIEKVLARFRSVFSQNLETLVGDNQDLFG